MKYLLYFFCFFSFFCSQAQREKIFIPKVDSTFEKIDVEEYKNFYQTNNKRILEKKFENGYITIEPQSFGYVKEFFLTGNPIETIFFYYKNGNIKRKGISWLEGKGVGLWYNFDENGKFTGTTDEDKDYVFGYKNVIDYCIKNKIPLRIGYEDKDDPKKAKINKSTLDGKPIWIIEWEYLKKIPRGIQDGVIREAHYQTRLVTVQLDGKTGKLISRKDIHTWQIY